MTETIHDPMAETTDEPSGSPSDQADMANGSGDPSGDGDGTGNRASTTAREWMAQLQTMIEGLASTAAPMARDIGIKAAELAAAAGEKAGPLAQRAAVATAGAGVKLAEKSRDFAAGLRQEDTVDADAATSPDEPAEA